MSETDVGLVTLEVAVDGERGGARTEGAADELYRQLQKYLPSALANETAEGDKGPLADLFSIGLALTSSGAIPEMVRCLRDWLSRRPSSRSVVIRDATGKQILSVNAENVDDATVVEALKVAAGTPT